MQLSEYIESILPLIKASRKFRSNNSPAAKHVHYLYVQAFYGFDEYSKRKASLDKAGYRSMRPENPLDAYTEVGIILED